MASHPSAVPGSSSAHGDLPASRIPPQDTTTAVDRDPIVGVLAQAHDLLALAISQSRARQSSTGSLIEHHPDDAWSARAESLFRRSHGEVLMTVPDRQSLTLERSRLLLTQVAELTARGVRVSILCPPEALAAASRPRYVQELDSRGASVRVTSVRLTNMIVVDSKLAMFWSEPEQDSQPVLVVRAEPIIRNVVELFSAAWSSACDIAVFKRYYRSERHVDDKTTQILRCLTGGLKDEVAARLLGVSVRTYRRYVADIIQSLDAESRFQAGARAAMLGLSSPGVPAPGKHDRHAAHLVADRNSSTPA